METLLVLGICAGFITTLIGFGGGMLLVSVMAFIYGPYVALALSSIALLVGNSQRLYMYRRCAQKNLSLAVVAGSVPGAFTGALIATTLPAWFLQAAIAIVVVASVLRRLWWREITLPRGALLPGSFGVAFLSATTGGGGFLMGPLILATGARGALYLATGAAGGVATHSFRLLGYQRGGVVTTELIASGLLVGSFIVLGNLLGRRARRVLGPRSCDLIEHTAPVLCALVALAGLL